MHTSDSCTHSLFPSLANSHTHTHPSSIFPHTHTLFHPHSHTPFLTHTHSHTRIAHAHRWPTGTSTVACVCGRSSRAASSKSMKVLSRSHWPTPIHMQWLPIAIGRLLPMIPPVPPPASLLLRQPLPIPPPPLLSALPPPLFPPLLLHSMPLPCPLSHHRHRLLA